MASLLDKWKEIKVDYEEATDRKKPSEKFLGVFRKKTGLEDAFKDLDEAVKKKELDDADKAFAAIQKAADAYQKVLFKAATAETDKEIQKDTKAMMTKLDKLVTASGEAVGGAAWLDRLTSLSDFASLMKKGTGKRLKSFAKSRRDEEKIEFLEAMVRKDYSNKTYLTFIKDNDVNVVNDLIKKFDPKDLGKGPWKEVTDQVISLVNNNNIALLNGSPKYRA